MKSRADIENLIIQLLAAESSEDPGELRPALLRGGAEMPVDSLLAVEVLAKVEQACGVGLEPNEETARAMRSVSSYAEVVWRQIEEQRESREESA